MKLLVFNLATDIDDPVLGFTSYWLKALAERVEHIDVITMRSGRLKLPENVRVHSVGKEKGYSELRRAVEFYRILWSLLQHHAYDGCFAHMMPLFLVMAAPLLRFRKIPGILWYTHKSTPFMLHLAARLADMVVTASKESFRIKSKNVRVIGHGIETEKFLPQEADTTSQQKFTILSVSRISAIKRLELLIQAVGRFHQEIPEFPFICQIVGSPLTTQDEKYVTKLQHQVQQLQLQDYVKFVGHVPFDDIIPYYQQADCFINVSQTGSIDKAVLEAMSCGLPVLVNPVFADMFGEKLGRICLIDWDEHLICRRLLELSHLTKAERDRLGRKLREIVIQHHNLQRLCERLLDEFKHLSECNKQT